MASKANEVLLQAARGLCALLGAPPFTARPPEPAAVLLPVPGRTAQDRARIYRQRYSRYLTVMRDHDCC